jgi:hypothetical protein
MQMITVAVECRHQHFGIQLQLLHDLPFSIYSLSKKRLSIIIAKHQNKPV